MRILIVTDACPEHVLNGVTRSYSRLEIELKKMGHKVSYIKPTQFFTVPMPKYNEIKLAINVWKVGKLIKKEMIEAQNNNEQFRIHIATEGPLGLSARRYLGRNKIKFTSSFHTRFDKYLKLYLPIIPEKISQKFLSNFHNKAERVLVTTESMKKELSDIGVINDKMVVWTRGADHLGEPKKMTLNYNKPIFVYVGRIALEKNIKDFLDLDLPGKKILVGTGPHLKKLTKEYPDAKFVGQKTNGELASYFASADVFVFPSKTETFGIVCIESLMAGTPVAGYADCPGTMDIFKLANGKSIGCLDKDLKKAALTALKADRDNCKEFAKQFTWKRCAEIFINNTAVN